MVSQIFQDFLSVTQSNKFTGKVSRSTGPVTPKYYRSIAEVPVCILMQVKSRLSFKIDLVTSAKELLSVPERALIVSTGGIWWILWFSVHCAAARREIFGVNALRGKLHQLGSPNLQDIFIGG